MRKFLFIGAVSVSAAMAASAAVPEKVIEKCDATVTDYSQMADCLKEGAFGAELLDLAVTPEFYGDAAQPEVDACLETNENYHTAWICFRNATEKAAETRGLIGVEKMKDACYAAISDPDVQATLEARMKEARARHMPDQMFYGGDMYHTFKGCPVVESTSSADEAAPIDPIAKELAQVLQPEDNPEDRTFSDRQCKILEGVDAKLADTPAEEIVAIFQASDDGGPSKFQMDENFSTLGVSADDAEYLKSNSEENESVGFALMALVHHYHPEALGKDLNENPFLSMIFNGALDNYKDECAQ
ncbi:hypothetical protein [Salipiger sp. PrR003]|uniref:hypothetical protein n=1 Tax=Salipiger sp. PrR003 TaxID=2706776 RepID=UPI0013DA49EB|nr:hypothetical protein [Salipiger sp. PrR003]NDV50190.1 hypothetical protein [Salipiger sp. PrR003]